MKSFSKRFASAAMAAAMVLSLAAVPTTDAQAATGATLTKKTSVQANKSYTYNLKGIKSSQYVKIYKSSGVTVKKGSTTLKNGAKLTGGKTIKLSVKASTKLTGKKYTLKAKVYNSKTKKYVKTVATKDVKVNYSTKGVTLDQTALEMVAGTTATLKATMTTEGTNSKIKDWSSSNDAVATVKDGVVTAVAAGTATITVMTSNAKTATCTVTVKAAEAALDTAANVADNVVRVTFTQDASKVVTKDNITVAAADIVPAVKAVKFSQDGKTADVELFTDLVNGKDYTVTYAGVEKTFTAKVGKVARIAITTASAAQNEETAINFQLFDADGIDVTHSSKVAATCVVTIDGTYSAAKITDASAATITMANVNDEATVKVTYSSGVAGEEDVVAEQKITCVAATAAQGSQIYAKTTNINDLSKCAKFYLGLSDKEVAVEEGNNTDNIYFCAKDAKGNVISYDSYEAESSSDDIANVTVDTASGKYAVLNVSGVQKGVAQINITATKNGAPTYYTIPVKVTNVKVAKTMTATIDKTTMSNSMDKDYVGKITAKLLDEDGNEVKGNFVYEVVTEGENLIKVDGATVKAHGARPRNYVIRVTGSDEKNGTPITKNVSVTVKDIIKATVSGSKAQNQFCTADPSLANTDETYVSTNAVKLTYQYEFERTSIDENPEKTDDDNITVKLYAMYNGLFAGYVRGTADGITIANDYVKADKNSKLNDVYTAVKYGTNYVEVSSNTAYVHTFNLTTVSNNSVAKNSASVLNNNICSFELKSISGNNTTPVKYVVNDANKGANYGYVAKTGTYTVESRLMYDAVSANGIHVAVTDNQAYKLLTKTFTVTNSVVNPTVTVANRNVNTMDMTEIRENLKASVDMNNNDSDYESVGTQEYKVVKNKLENDSASGTTFTLKYVEVTDKYGDVEWKFYVPVNQTFKTK